jgi:hypothetical protein
MMTARARPAAYVLAAGLAITVVACGSQGGDGDGASSNEPAPFTRVEVERAFSSTGIPLIVGLDLEGQAPVADYDVIRNENVVVFYRQGSRPDRLAAVESALAKLGEEAD